MTMLMADPSSASIESSECRQYFATNGMEMIQLSFKPSSSLI